MTSGSSEFETLFANAGFNGCIGSTDATHFGMLSYDSWSTISHCSNKLNTASRNYNATVTHCRQILGTTSGNPYTWNNNTVILYDKLVISVNEGELFDGHEFTLLEFNSERNIADVQYRGVWFTVENGYLSWSCIVPPINNRVTYKYVKFSEWLESLRKDLECTFGIMKGRFCILRYGTRLCSLRKCDQVWATCCVLHNRLLFIDGLHKNWSTGKLSNWEIRDDKFKNSTAGKFALNRLTRYHHNELEAVANADSTTVSNDRFDKHTLDGKIIVKNMPLSVFQQCLVKYFDIRFKINTIK